MRMSIRFWQTALFLTVTLVAAVVLYVEFLPAIEDSMGNFAQEELAKDLEDLSARMELALVSGENAVEKQAAEFSKVHGVDIWIFDSEGEEIHSEQSLTEPGARLDEILRRGLDRKAYKYTNLSQNLIVVSKPIKADGKLLGVAIISDNGTFVNAALKDARDRLLIALFIAILVSAILGFMFSEVIAKQIKRLKEGALAIAQGNFNLRLKKGLVPDDVGELARTFNVMAEKLADAFDALRSQQEQILTVVNSMSEGVIEVSAAGMINLANPAAAQLLDFPVQKLIGSQLETLISEPGLLNCVRKALSGQDSSSICEYHKRFLLLHSAPIKLPESVRDSEKKNGVVLILQDFTEQKRLEQAQRSFISNASHELRTPIASIKGFIELLEDGAKDKPEVRDNFLVTMQREIDRLQRLVDDLLTLTQLDSGLNILQLAEHPIDKIISEVAAVATPLAASAKVRLKMESRAGKAIVICDRDRIIQVLLGFFDNALKHTRESGEIVVFSHLTDHAVRVGVRDTGFGIPPDKLGKIFERFFRSISSEGKVQTKGSGLGLSIASEIIKAHGGKIKVSSKKGKGSTFSFKLRLAKN